MADGPTPAVTLMAKAEQDKAAAVKRIAELRKAAAGELGEVVLAAGAQTLPPRELKALLVAIMAAGPAKALELLSSGSAKPNAKAAGAGSQANGRNHGEESGHVTA